MSKTTISMSRTQGTKGAETTEVALHFAHRRFKMDLTFPDTELRGSAALKFPVPSRARRLGPRALRLKQGLCPVHRRVH